MLEKVRSFFAKPANRRFLAFVVAMITTSVAVAARAADPTDAGQLITQGYTAVTGVTWVALAIGAAALVWVGYLLILPLLRRVFRPRG